MIMRRTHGFSGVLYACTGSWCRSSGSWILITDEAEKQRKIDLLSYQVQEIEDAGLTAGEEQTLESRRKVLSNASAIRDRLAQSYALLSGE